MEEFVALAVSMRKRWRCWRAYISRESVEDDGRFALGEAVWKGIPSELAVPKTSFWSRSLSIPLSW